MVDSFDSRALRIQDCYGQRFMKPGVYRYNILPVLGHYVTDERPFSIRAMERMSDTRMNQHSLVIRAERGHFRVDQPEIEIEAGDLVLWNCPDARAVPYQVVGDKEFFASYRLVNESGYSHAFSATGEYFWVDAHGSGVSGVVRVKDPDCRSEIDFQQWRQQLAKGMLVMITGERVEPQEIEIVTGQTVFFSITQGPGISITDRRLLAGNFDPSLQKRS